MEVMRDTFKFFMKTLKGYCNLIEDKKIKHLSLRNWSMTLKINVEVFFSMGRQSVQVLLIKFEKYT